MRTIMFGFRNTGRYSDPRRCRLGFEILESRVLPSVMVMEVEPNDKENGSAFFTFPTDDGAANLQGTAANQRDRDFFAFTITSSTTLNIQVGSSNGVLAKLRIDDTLGNKVLATKPKEGINSSSAAVVLGRTYFVQLRSKGSNPAAYD